MSSSNLAPWAVTCAAVAVAVWSWTRPAPAPVSPPRVAVAPVSSPAPPDETVLSALVEQAVREALAERTQPPPPVHPGQTAAREEGLALVDEIVARGEASVEDRAHLRALLGRTDREGLDAILSAYITALNRGEIQAPAGQPAL